MKEGDDGKAREGQSSFSSSYLLRPLHRLLLCRLSLLCLPRRRSSPLRAGGLRRLLAASSHNSNNNA